VVESTYNWYWLVDGLMERATECIWANPAAMQQYRRPEVYATIIPMPAGWPTWYDWGYCPKDIFIQSREGSARFVA